MYYKLPFFKWLHKDERDLIFQINTWFYLAWNWLELFILVIFTYLIRNVRDELNISLELFFINVSWTLFSSLYMGFTFYFISYPDVSETKTENYI